LKREREAGKIAMEIVSTKSDGLDHLLDGFFEKDWDMALSKVEDFMLTGFDVPVFGEPTEEVGGNEVLKDNIEVVEVPSAAITSVEVVVEQEVVEAQSAAKDAAPSVNNAVLVEESTTNIGA
ncbi:hypothetical protein Dimus_016664, partial [Dionaea muscipula]